MDLAEACTQQDTLAGCAVPCAGYAAPSSSGSVPWPRSIERS